MNRSRNRNRNRTPIAQPTDPLAALKAKFARLSQIKHQMTAAKALYVEHDAIVKDLLPMFVSIQEGQYVIQKRITIGTESHTLVPFFYDAQRGGLKVKNWKSTAMETFTID